MIAMARGINFRQLYLAFVAALSAVVIMSHVGMKDATQPEAESRYNTVVWHNPLHGTANAEYDVHDGTIVQWKPGGLYYWYGMAYTDCQIESNSMMGLVHKALNSFVTNVLDNFNCAAILFPGFGEDCQFLTPAKGQTVHIYSSDNLHTWKFEGPAFQHYPVMPDGHDVYTDSIFFRPAVIYNQANDMYVMWVNRIPRGASVLEGYHDGGFITAQSKSPTGPFVIMERQPEMHYRGGGDFAIMADGYDAWIAYGSWFAADERGTLKEKILGDDGVDGHAITVQKLTYDFMDVDPSEHNRVTENGNEAPLMFKRGDWYYLVYGTLCCFCRAGGDAKVKVSKNPMGNWTYLTNINPKDEQHIPAQNSAIIQVRTTSYTGEDKDDTFVWYGDLWQSSIKGTKAAENHHRAIVNFVDQEMEIEGVKQVVPVPLRMKNERWTVVKDVWLPEPQNPQPAAEIICDANNECEPNSVFY